MKIRVDIPDDKNTKLLSSHKAKVLKGLQDAINEVKQIRQGEMKGVAGKDLLNELNAGLCTQLSGLKS